MGKLYEPKALAQLIGSLPSDDWSALIELNDAIRKRLDDIGVKSPFQKLTTTQAAPLYEAVVIVGEFIRRNFKNPLDYESGKSPADNWNSIQIRVQEIRKALHERNQKSALEDLKREMQGAVEAADQVRKNERFGYATLSDDDRGKIFRAIEKLRELIQSSELSKRKKDALMAKLSELHKEAAREHTATERFFGFLGELSFVFGEMAENAKPAIEETKDILRIVMDRRKENEGIELPAPKDLPRLPSPDDKKEDSE